MSENKSDITNQKLAWMVPESNDKVKKWNCRDNFYEFTDSSSMHGLKYIGDFNLHPSERIFWAISFILAVIAAAYFISNLFTKFQDMPVIMSISPSNVDLTDIPFPAITLCNMNNVRRRNAEEILKNSKKNVPNPRRKALNDFCGSKISDTSAYDSIDDNITTSDWKQSEALMIELTQPCHELLINCTWNGLDKPCMEIFNPTLTDEGMCCTFNSLDRAFIFRNPRDLSLLNVTFNYTSVNWTPEKGYPPDTDADFLPWRPMGAGSHIGLSIVVDMEVDQYYCSSENSIGMKIIFHNPIETPKMTAFGSFIPPGQEIRYDIKPLIYVADSQLMSISVDKRQCYFESERYLKYYRTYTLRNCRLECEANFTLAYCHCVQYFSPKGSNTRICSSKDANCAKEAQRTMEVSLQDPKDGRNFTFINEAYLNTTIHPCNCLPGCTEVGYEGQQSISPLSSSIHIPEQFLNSKDAKYFVKNMGIIHFFFTKKQFTAVARGVLYGFTEFLSNTGGLLGLFMGFSFLSVVEIVYFMTLRIWCGIRQTKDTEKKQKLTEQNTWSPLPFTQ